MNNIPRFDWSTSHYSQSDEVVIKTIHTVEETRQALQLLQERKVVILILDRLSIEQAQRVVDWMAGGACAIDGQTFWISEKTFMVLPNQVKLTTSRPPSASISPCLKTSGEIT